MPVEDINPYQASQVDANLFQESDPRSIGQWRKKVWEYRLRMRALAGLSMVAAMLCSTGLSPFSPVPRGVVVSVCILWLLVAVATYARRLSGVIAAIALGAISLIALTYAALRGGEPAWLGLTVISAPTAAAGVAMGLQLLRWAAEIRAAGIPLTALPDDVARYLAAEGNQPSAVDAQIVD